MKQISEYLSAKAKMKNFQHKLKLPDKPIGLNAFIDVFDYSGFIQLEHKPGHNWVFEIKEEDDAAYIYVKHTPKHGGIYYSFAFKGKGKVSSTNMIYSCEIVENKEDIKQHDFGEAYYDQELKIGWPLYEKFKEAVEKRFDF